MILFRNIIIVLVNIDMDQGLVCNAFIVVLILPAHYITLKKILHRLFDVEQGILDEHGGNQRQCQRQAKQSEEPLLHYVETIATFI